MKFPSLLRIGKKKSKNKDSSSSASILPPPPTPFASQDSVKDNPSKEPEMECKSPDPETVKSQECPPEMIIIKKAPKSAYSPPKIEFNLEILSLSPPTRSFATLFDCPDLMSDEGSMKKSTGDALGPEKKEDVPLLEEILKPQGEDIDLDLVSPTVGMFNSDYNGCDSGFDPGCCWNTVRSYNYCRPCHPWNLCDPCGCPTIPRKLLPYVRKVIPDPCPPLPETPKEEKKEEEKIEEAVPEAEGGNKSVFSKIGSSFSKIGSSLSALKSSVSKSFAKSDKSESSSASGMGSNLNTGGGSGGSSSTAPFEPEFEKLDPVPQRTRVYQMEVSQRAVNEAFSHREVMEGGSTDLASLLTPEEEAQLKRADSDDSLTRIALSLKKKIQEKRERSRSRRSSGPDENNNAGIVVIPDQITAFGSEFEKISSSKDRSRTDPNNNPVKLFTPEEIAAEYYQKVHSVRKLGSQECKGQSHQSRSSRASSANTYTSISSSSRSRKDSQADPDLNQGQTPPTRFPKRIEEYQDSKELPSLVSSPRSARRRPIDRDPTDQRFPQHRVYQRDRPPGAISLIDEGTQANLPEVPQSGSRVRSRQKYSREIRPIVTSARSRQSAPPPVHPPSLPGDSGRSTKPSGRSWNGKPLAKTNPKSPIGNVPFPYGNAIKSTTDQTTTRAILPQKPCLGPKRKCTGCRSRSRPRKENGGEGQEQKKVHSESDGGGASGEEEEDEEEPPKEKCLSLAPREPQGGPPRPPEPEDFCHCTEADFRRERQRLKREAKGSGITGWVAPAFGSSYYPYGKGPGYLSDEDSSGVEEGIWNNPCSTYEEKLESFLERDKCCGSLQPLPGPCLLCNDDCRRLILARKTRRRKVCGRLPTPKSPKYFEDLPADFPKDFVRYNALKVIQTPAATPKAKIVLTRNGDKVDFCRSGLARLFVTRTGFGTVPNYIKCRKRELEFCAKMAETAEKMKKPPPDPSTSLNTPQTPKPKQPSQKALKL